MRTLQEANSSLRRKRFIMRLCGFKLKSKSIRMTSYLNNRNYCGNIDYGLVNTYWSYWQ